MDEVRARRALQRVAYAEDWLSRLKDDLAAGHNRSAMTHLLTAQAELRMLSEQLAPELGWADVPAEAPVAATTPAFAGLPRRTPYAWASLAVACLALAMFTGMLVPQRPRTIPTIVVTEAGDPAHDILAAVPPIPAPVLPPPASETAPMTAEPDSQAATPSLAEAGSATSAPAPLSRRVRPRRDSVIEAAPVSSGPAASEPAAVSTVSEPGPASPPLASPVDFTLEAFRAIQQAIER